MVESLSEVESGVCFVLITEIVLDDLGSFLRFFNNFFIFWIEFAGMTVGLQLKWIIGDFALGNINDGIGHNENHVANINTLDSITRRSQSTDECWNCPISRGCGWCTALNYQETGTPNKRCTYICWMHRARSLANVYFWNKVFKKNNLVDEFKLQLSKELSLQIIDEKEYELLYSLSKKED